MSVNRGGWGSPDPLENAEVKEFKLRFWLQRWIHLGLGLGVVGLAVACSPVERLGDPAALNSRYTDEQPALSGNRRFRLCPPNGSRNILMYD